MNTRADSVSLFQSLYFQGIEYTFKDSVLFWEHGVAKMICCLQWKYIQHISNTAFNILNATSVQSIQYKLSILMLSIEKYTKVY